MRAGAAGLGTGVIERLGRLGGRVQGLYATDPAGEVVVLVGPPPPTDLLVAAAGMAATPGAPRPGARKLEAGHVVRVPAVRAALLWWVEPAPDEASGRPGELSTAMIRALVEASTALRQGHEPTAIAMPPTASPVQPAAGDALAGRLLRALAGLPRSRGRRRLRQTLAAIGEATGWTGLAAIELRGEKVRRITGLDVLPSAKRPSLAVFAEELRASGRRYLAASRTELQRPAVGGLAEAPAGFTPAAAAAGTAPHAPGTADAEGPALELFLEQHGLQRFAMALPAGDGIGLYAEGADGAEAMQAAVDAIAAREGRRRLLWRPWLKRSVVLVLAAGGLVLLALPAPLEIGAPAELRPADGEVVVVPHEARLVELLVRVGEQVAPGQVLARFSSTPLEEAEARAALDQLLEGLSAQEALAAGDYARYQLAEQRREIAALKAEQGRRRLAELAITAPAAGRIADLLPRSQIGALLPAGSAVGEIERGGRIEAVLQLAASDAPHVRAGSRGSVVVRGLVDRHYPLTLLEDPLVHTRDDGSTTLSVRAEITADGTTELFKGLTGFARIEAGERPRVFVLLRPVTDYLRLFAWRYLGLRL